jgi:hypothetical protein
MRFVGFFGAMVLAGSAAAQQAPADLDTLARSLANPLASSTTVGSEIRLAAGEGQGRHGLVNEIGMQRPFSLPQAWMIATITKLPITITRNSDQYTGVGDLTFNTFLVTPPRNNLYIGLGLTSSMPTATRAGLGSRNWEAGPAAGIYYQDEKFTTGLRLGQRWTVAGPSNTPRTTNSALLGQFSMGLGNGWSTGVSTDTQYDWETTGRSRWTVPISASLGRVFNFNNNYATEISGFATHYALTGGPLRSVWEVGFNLILVVPRGFLFR